MGEFDEDGLHWDGRRFVTRAGVRYQQRTGAQVREHGGSRMVLASPGQIDGLDVVLRAVKQRRARGESVRSLQPLTLVCYGDRGHVIGRVYLVPGAGPVLLAEGADWQDSGRTEWAQGTVTHHDPETGEPWEVEVDERQPVMEIVHRVGQFAAVLDEQGPTDRWVSVQCRCRSIDVSVSQVRALLTAGRPRVRIGVSTFRLADPAPG